MNSRLLLAFFWIAPLGFAVAQTSPMEALKSFYQGQEDPACLALFPTDSLPAMQIVMVRHGEPDLYKKGWRNRKASEQYTRDYDSATVIPFETNPICLETVGTSLIFHSSLPRARHTAQLLFADGFTLEEDSRFRELERKVMKFINMKLPLKFWMGASRVFWMIGLNDRGIENKKQGKGRVKGNAAFLAEVAQKDKQAIVVAHGLHNRYLMKALKKRGWKLVRKGGSRYWAVNIMARSMD